MTFAHVAGVPLEELLTLSPAAGALLLALRARARQSNTVAGALLIRSREVGPLSRYGDVYENRVTGERAVACVAKRAARTSPRWSI